MILREPITVIVMIIIVVAMFMGFTIFAIDGGPCDPAVQHCIGDKDADKR